MIWFLRCINFIVSLTTRLLYLVLGQDALIQMGIMDKPFSVYQLYGIFLIVSWMVGSRSVKNTTKQALMETVGTNKVFFSLKDTKIQVELLSLFITITIFPIFLVTRYLVLFFWGV